MAHSRRRRSFWSRLGSTSKAQTPNRRTRSFESLEPRQLLVVDLLGAPDWSELGPAPTFSVERSSSIGIGSTATSFDDKNPVVGAVLMVAPHPTNADILLAASVNGGIWKTTNATADSPNWSVKTDALENLSMGAIAFSPSNPAIAAAGFGKTSSFASVGGEAGGILISEDTGETWQLRARFDNFTEESITSIAFGETNPDLILVSTKSFLNPGAGGVYRSTDRGSTWTKVLGAENARATDLRADYENNVFYAVILNDGVYRSDATGQNWVKKSTGVNVTNAVNAKISVHDDPTDATDAVYVGVIGSDGKLGNLYRSENTGDSWTQLTNPTTDEGQFDEIDNDNDTDVDEADETNVFGLLSSGNGAKLFSLVADFSDPNVLYVGGDTQPTASATGNSAGCTKFTGRIFKGTVGAGGATTWTQIVCSGADRLPGQAGGETAPHADSRFMTFDVNGDLLQTDDGGIYKLTGGNDKFWIARHGNMSVTEVTSVAYDPRLDIAVFGAQDNGSSFQLQNGGTEWQNGFGGDGYYQDIDPAFTATTSRWFSMANNMNFFVRSDLQQNGAGKTEVVPNSLKLVSLSKSGETAPADNRKTGLGKNDTKLLSGSPGVAEAPFALNRFDRERMLIGGFEVYESFDRGETLKQVQALPSKGAFTTAIYYGHAQNIDLAYVARGSRLYQRTKAGGKFKEIDLSSAGITGIRDISVDPDDPRRVFIAADGTGIVQILNAGQTSAALPAAQRQKIEAITHGIHFRANTAVEAIKVGAKSVLLAGGPGGLIRAIYGAADQEFDFDSFGRKMPQGIVSDIDYNATDDVVIVGMLGRGVFLMENASTFLPEPDRLQIDGTPGEDTIRIARNTGDPTQLDVFVNSAVPSGTFPIERIRRIVVDAKELGDTLIVDVAGGVLPFEKITFKGGDGNDTVTLQGPAVEKMFEPPVNGVGAAFASDEISGLIIVTETTEFITDALTIVVAPQAAAMQQLQTGVELASDLFQELNVREVDSSLPIFGSSLVAGLQRGAIPGSFAAHDPIANHQLLTTSLKPEFVNAGKSLLRRLLEDGLNGFSIGAIGSASIDSFTALRDKLELLDGVAGNGTVAMTLNAGLPTYQVQLTKNLKGTSDLDLSTAGGLLAFAGHLEMSADVTLRVTFGIDAQGFFIDADGSAQPELTVSNFAMTNASASGRLGLLEASLTGGTLSSDPNARVTFDLEELANPITGIQDGKLRLSDLLEGKFESVRFTAAVQGNPGGAADLALAGKFTVNAFNANIVDADISLAWDNLQQVTQVTLQATSDSPGAKLLKLLSVEAQQVVDGLLGPGGLSGKLEGLVDSAASTVLSRPIPVLGRSLGELLLGAPKEVHFGAPPAGATATPIVRISPVALNDDEDAKRFTVTVADINPSQLGVAEGDVVTYLGAGNQQFTGTVESVEPGTFVVEFASALTQDPQTLNPAISVQTGGSFTRQLKAMLGNLATGGRLVDELPTLDQLLFELGQLTGIDALADVNVDLDAGLITFPLRFDPDPLKFSHHFDLGEDTPGLAFNSVAALTIDPNYAITVGLKLGEVSSLADRFFIVENAAPEISLHFDASLDGALSAQLGFLGLTATKTAGVPGGNNGITFVGDLSLNLQEPGADGGLGNGDNRITLSDIVTAAGGGAGNLASVFQPNLVADIDIDGIDVVGSAFGQTIASMHIQLAGDAPTDPGHIVATSFSQLQSEIAQLISGLQVTGTVNTDFSNISFESLIGILNQVGVGLVELSSKLNPSTGIPLVRKAVNEVVQLGQAITNVTEQFIVRDPQTDEIVDYTVKSVQEFLAEAPALLGIPGAQITYSAATHRLEFGISKDFNFSRSTELDFEGSLGSAIDVRASGAGAFDADAHLAFGMGVDLTPLTGNQSLLDKFFLKTGTGNEITVAATISASNVDLGAAVGILGVGIDNGTLNLSVGTGVQLVDPSGTPNDGRLYLTELFANPLGSVSLKPFTASGNAHLPIVIEGVSFGNSQPAIDVTLANNFSISATPNADFNNIIQQFQSFSLDDLGAVLNQVIGILEGANINAFHKKLPLVNKSVDELLTVITDLTTAAEQAIGSIDLTKVQTAIDSFSSAVEALPGTIDVTPLTDLLSELTELAAVLQSHVDAGTLPPIETLRKGFAAVSHGFDGVIESVTAALSGDIGQSIRDQFDIARDALEDAVPSLQSLTRFLTKTVKLGGDNTVTISIEDADTTAAIAPAIVVRLHLAREFDSSLPLDFGVVAGTTNIPLAFETGGELDLFAGGSLDLNFGINVKRLFQGQQPFFILDDSGIGLDVSANIDNLLANVNIGGIAAGIGSTIPNPDVFGTIALTNQAATGPAHVGLDVTGGDSFHAVYFDVANFASHLDFTGINGKLNATLPLFIGGTQLGNIAVSMPDITDPSTFTISPPNGLLSALLNGEFTLDSLIAGIDSFLGLLERALEGETLHKLPIIGDNLDAGAVFVNELRTKFNQIIAAVNLNTLEANLEDQIFNLLGPSGINILAGASGCVSGNPVPAEINAPAFKTGLVNVVLTTAADGAGVIVGLPKEVLLNVRICDQRSTTVKLDLNLGGLKFGVQTEGGIDLELGYDVEFGFGLAKGQGFFFQLDTNAADPEIEVNATASLANGTTIDANLFFLDVQATERSGGENTGFNGLVTVNINDPGTGIDANNRLSFKEIRDSSAQQLLTPFVNGSADVDLHLVAGVNSANGAELPQISTDLAITWNFLNQHGLTGDKPDVAFNNIQLDLGEFLTRSLKPVLSRVQDTIEPIKPILDFLTAPIPVISTLSEAVGLGETSFLTLLGAASPAGQQIAKFINVADGIVDFIADITGLGPNASIVLNFGNFVPGASQDLRTPSLIDVAAGSNIPGPGGSIDNQINNSSANGLMDSLLAPPSTTIGGGASGLGISFPILQQPSNLFKVLFGQTVDVVTWDVPAFDVNLGPLTKRFGPILPPIPLFVTIGGSLRAFADLFVGFDTRGLAKTGQFFDGFYIGDFNAQGQDVPEFGVSATVAAGAELNLLVASAGVEGGITATFGANWHDRDNDGKFYLDEIADRFARGTGHDIEDLGNLSPGQVLTGLSCLFDFTGETRAFLQAYVDTPVTDRLTFPNPPLSTVLFSIDKSLCPASADLELGIVRTDQTLVRPLDTPVNDPTPQLDTLVAFVGPEASNRSPGATDIGESITIRQTAFNNNNGKATITITGFGVTRSFTGVEAIYVDAGAGNDVITVDEDGTDAVTIPVLVLGNEGDDVLNGGGLKGSLFGGDGDDDINPGPLRPGKFIDIAGDFGFDEIIQSVEDDITIVDNIIDDLNLGSGPFIPHTGFEGFRGIGNNIPHIIDVTNFGGSATIGGSGTTIRDRANTDFGLSDTRLDRGRGRGSVVLQNVGAINVGDSGNVGRQTFTLNNFHGTATINAGIGGGRLGGKSVVINHEEQFVNLSDSGVTLGGGGQVSFAGAAFGGARIRGGAAAQTFNVSLFSAQVDLDGGGGGDSAALGAPVGTASGAIYSVVNNDGPSIVNIDVAGNITSHNLANISAVTLTGTPFNDTLNGVGSTIPITFHALAGNDNLTGSSLADSLFGDGDNDTILGGAGSDLFDGGLGDDDLVGTPDSGTTDIVRGGGGFDTYIEQDNIAVWTLSDTGLQKSGRGPVNFDQSDIDDVELTNGIINAEFDITGWSHAGLFQASENRTLTDRRGGAFTITPTQLIRPNAAPINNIAGFTNVNIGGAANATNDSLTVNGFLGQLTFTGGGGTDSIIASRDTNFTLTNGLLTGGDGGFYNLLGVESAQLTGGAGGNTFNVNEFTGAVVLDGAGGTDIVPTYGATPTTSASIIDIKALGANALSRNIAGTPSGSLQLTNIEQLTLTGGTQSDALEGSSLTMPTTITGGNGDDTLFGGSAADSLDGGNGNDRLFGNGSADQLVGGANNDTYFLGNAFGNDTITEAAASGTDIINAFAVTTPITFTMNAGSVTVASGGSTVTHTGTAIEQLIGGTSDDLFTFGASGVSFAGGSGTVNGGPGSDTLSYQIFNALALISVNLLTGTGNGLAGISQIENVIGGLGNDNLTGDNNANILEGRNGSDIITGNGGNDTIVDGIGSDTVDGGSGDDIYINAPAASATDTITDASGIDTLDMSTTNSTIVLDLDLLGVNQNYNSTANLRLNNIIENYVGSGGADTISVDPLSVPRNLIGRNPTTTPGDVLNYNGQNRPTVTGTGLFHSAGFQPVTFSQFETINPTATLDPPARVTGVSVGLLSDIDATYDIPVGSGAQLASLPWNRIDKINITFSENVNIQETDLLMAGVNTDDYSFANFTYNSGTRTATWTLNSAIERQDKILLVIRDSDVTDLQGHDLDGEWDGPTSTVDPTSSVYPSGDIFYGGNFAFRFNVLPGDSNQDGLVSRADIAAMMSRQFTEKSEVNYSLLADLNADGVINANDSAFTLLYTGAVLPGGEPDPSPPAPSPAPAAAGAVVQKAATSRTALVDTAFAVIDRTDRTKLRVDRKPSVVSTRSGESQTSTPTALRIRAPRSAVASRAIDRLFATE